MRAFNSNTKFILAITGLTLSIAIITACVHGRNEARRPGSDGNFDGFDQASIVTEYDKLNDSEKTGREIWYKATAGNQRYHSYTFPQRVNGRRIPWGRFLKSDERPIRFSLWG